MPFICDPCLNELEADQQFQGQRSKDEDTSTQDDEENPDSEDSFEEHFFQAWNDIRRFIVAMMQSLQGAATIGWSVHLDKERPALPIPLLKKLETDIASNHCLFACTELLRSPTVRIYFDLSSSEQKTPFQE